MKCPICSEEFTNKKDLGLHFYLNEDNRFHDNIELLVKLIEEKEELEKCNSMNSS